MRRNWTWLVGVVAVAVCGVALYLVMSTKKYCATSIIERMKRISAEEMERLARVAAQAERFTRSAGVDEDDEEGEGGTPRFANTVVRRRVGMAYTASPPAGAVKAERVVERPIIEFEDEVKEKATASRTAEEVRLWKRSLYQPAVSVSVGPNASLKLVRMRVYTIIEGPRARTVVDHIFFNPYNKNLEGRFEYNLPSGASVCYYAMFVGTGKGMPQFFNKKQQKALTNILNKGLDVGAYASLAAAGGSWGELRVAKVVPRESATEAYEKILRRGVDPALLRRGAENKFVGRVFPIQPKAYNRVIIAYEETLPFISGRLLYRFCFPKSSDAKELSIRVSVLRDDFVSVSSKVEGSLKGKREGKGRDLLFADFSGKKPASVTITLQPRSPNIHVVAGTHTDGKRYFYARLYPYIPTESKGKTLCRAVFALDTSLSESPDRFGVAVRLMEAILERDKEIKEFAVLLFDVGARWLRLGESFWVANTPDGRSALRRVLDSVLLEGATDIGAALDKIAAASEKHPSDLPVNIHMFTNGYISWGQEDARRFVGRFWRRCRWRARIFCYRTGIGAENRGVLEALSARGGGVFNCMSRDAIEEAALAHKRLSLKLERVKAEGAVDVLLVGGVAAVYPGGCVELVGRPVGEKVRVKLVGEIGGRKVEREFEFDVRGESRLAARAWAQTAVAHLESLNDPSLRNYITALAQHFNISSRYTNFLVLESERDYRIYKVDTERRLIKEKDLGAFLAAKCDEAAREVPARRRFSEALQYLLRRKRFKPTKAFERFMELLPDEAFEPPSVDLGDSLVRISDVPKDYLEALRRKSKNADVFAEEAERRRRKANLAAAIRALSSIVELHKGSNEAMRFVAYWLMDAGRADVALALYLDLLEMRPFDAQLWREYALAAADAKRYLLSAALFEVVTTAKWSRFRRSMRIITLGEYEDMLRKALSDGSVSAVAKSVLGDKLEEVHRGYRSVAGGGRKVALRVTIGWNTDNSDVDLWVIEPTGEKCFYQHRKTRIGGVLLDDVTDGYGPERYELANAVRGRYKVVVHYYSATQTAIGGRTRVSVLVQKYPGTVKEEVRRFVVTLRREKEAIHICDIIFP